MDNQKIIIGVVILAAVFFLSGSFDVEGVTGNVAKGVNGHWSFCSNTNLCGNGEGDCDRDSHCQAGLKCVNDVGIKYYGDRFGKVDVCEGTIARAGKVAANLSELSGQPITDYPILAGTGHRYISYGDCEGSPPDMDGGCPEEVAVEVVDDGVYCKYKSGDPVFSADWTTCYRVKLAQSFRTSVKNVNGIGSGETDGCTYYVLDEYIGIPCAQVTGTPKQFSYGDVVQNMFFVGQDIKLQLPK